MRCTIMIDGWIDKKRRTIINFLVSNRKWTMFLKSIDVSAISKTTEKVFEKWITLLKRWENTMSFKLWQIIQQTTKRKRLCAPCIAHCVNLMLEDYEKKIPIHEEIILKGKKKKNITFFYSRTSLISLLQYFKKGIYFVALVHLT